MDKTPQDVLDWRLECFEAGDLDGIMQDYTAESILFTPMGVFHGPAEIRDAFAGLFAEFTQPGAAFEIDEVMVEDDVGYVLWRAETADNVYELGTETFVIRDGKIVVETFTAKIAPKD